MPKLSYTPFYTLTRHVEYEGATFLGNFTSIEQVFAYLSQLEGYLMDEWQPQASELDTLDAYDTDKHGVTSGWDLNGPGDMSFRIYACSVSSV